MTMLGRYCLEENPEIATAGYIDVLARIGVSAHATRLTVSRMTERGLLERSRQGRAAYFRASEVGLRVVRVQQQRTFHDTGEEPQPPGAWTVLCFSLPETHRKERHLLRRSLAWESFGLLRDGVWLAPGERDVSAILAQLPGAGVDQHVEVFTAYPKFEDVPGMISRTWHLDELAERYHRFLRSWDVPDPVPEALDDLGRDLILASAWRQLLRETPRLPAGHLPDGWPAARCHELFRTLHESYRPDADRRFAGILAEHRMS
ncbi:PaaX family transcriptional regulator [Amycolatopsis saalfeldensis]|uniref:Transcriptional regulator, PaaX family n=1 Tax=Amycolatopsis saalfeldensis TaxID=394193 RepID=A0A1H8XFM8_9PSEU|nr:PaaX family transcriptional regulator C-terminal domain-containing protein [Amycolatopsis saalfeldensis]SEP38058.1 transcriptional regulator, PaaX family [Amycolatopsis saalfeldensis]